MYGAVSLNENPDPVKFPVGCGLTLDENRKDGTVRSQVFSLRRADGFYAVFGGIDVSEKEMDEWLSGYEQKGWQYLIEIPKPVWSFFWNPRKKEAILAADRFRIHSLFWMHTDGAVHFSTSLKTLLVQTSIPLDIDETALYAYLDLLCVPAGMSIQRGVQKLAAGTCLCISQGKVTRHAYYQPEYSPKLAGDETTLKHGIRAGIQDAVARSLSWIENRPFACFLSGGTDSSSLLGGCSQIHGPGVPAYSVTFAEDAWNEIEYARIAASHFSAEHRIVQFNMEDSLRISNLLATLCDEPMGNSSLLATFRCVEAAAADGIGSMIAGDGGDELFGGNERYAIDAVYARYEHYTSPLIRSILKRLAEFAAVRIPSKNLQRIARMLSRGQYQNPERYYRDDAFAYQIFPDDFLDEFSCKVRPTVNLDLFRQYYQGIHAVDEIDRLLYIDMQHTLGDNDLVKVGISGQAHGLAIMYPMLDTDLVSYACRLPGWAKLQGREKRYLFKKAMTGFLPDAILQKKKQGFGVPIGAWLKTSPQFNTRFREVVFDRGGLASRVFKMEFVERLFNEHQADIKDNNMLMWGIFCMNLWADQAKNWCRKT